MNGQKPTSNSAKAEFRGPAGLTRASWKQTALTQGLEETTLSQWLQAPITALDTQKGTLPPFVITFVTTQAAQRVPNILSKRLF